MSHRPIITLLTDFGWKDGYIGAMKGVILKINPACRIIDLAHEIPRHDVMAAALVLRQTYHFFPSGAIHIVVVDPGVGGPRRPLVLETSDYRFVGPDNGCFTFVLKRQKGIRAYELIEKQFHLPRVSHTFHGRDIFAPVAAYLSKGVSPAAMGPPIETADLTALSIPDPAVNGEALCGEVIGVDSFGNLITTISRDAMEVFAPEGIVEIEIGGERITGLKSSYGEGRAGEVIALWGSTGFLEIALKEQDLQRERGWGRGEEVRIRRGS
jgi:S-adenosylmethionine hydrolase